MKNNTIAVIRRFRAARDHLQRIVEAGERAAEQIRSIDEILATLDSQTRIERKPLPDSQTRSACAR
jgi:hypothetical protein